MKPTNPLVIENGIVIDASLVAFRSPSVLFMYLKRFGLGWVRGIPSSPVLSLLVGNPTTTSEAASTIH